LTIAVAIARLGRRLRRRLGRRPAEIEKPPEIYFTHLCCVCTEVLPLNPDLTLRMDEVELTSRDGVEDSRCKGYAHTDCISVDLWVENHAEDNVTRRDPRAEEDA
jgi:hypothetical protein